MGVHAQPQTPTMWHTNRCVAVHDDDIDRNIQRQTESKSLKRKSLTAHPVSYRPDLWGLRRETKCLKWSASFGIYVTAELHSKVVLWKWARSGWVWLYLSPGGFDEGPSCCSDCQIGFHSIRNRCTFLVCHIWQRVTPLRCYKGQKTLAQACSVWKSGQT